MATRQPTPASPTTVPAILAVAAIVAGAATWFGYPGLILAAPALAFAASAAPPAILTGKRDSSGLPSAASPGEANTMNRYRMWSELKLRAVTPSADWLPGWPLRLWWFTAIAAGVLAAALPSPALGDWWRLGVGVSVFAAIVSFNGALRRWTAPDDPCDGPTANLLIKRLPGVGLTVAASIITAAASFLTTLVIVDRLNLTNTLGVVAPWMAATAVALLLTSTGLALAVRPAALDKWKTMVRVRSEWEPRWQIAKLDPQPRLVDHIEHGAVSVDTFDAHPSIGAAAVHPLIGKINAALGSGSKAAVLESPDVDSQGQPLQGTKNATRFRIATFITDQMPDINNPNTDKQEALLRISAAFSWMADSEGYGRWVINGITPLHNSNEENTTAAWQIDFAAPDGPSAKDMRHGPRGTIGAFADSEMLIDHAQNAVYMGTLTTGTTTYLDDNAQKAMENIATTDQWDENWSNILKLGAVRPRPEHAVYTEATHGRATLKRQPFVVQQGMDPLEFFKLEAKISTTLKAAPFVAVTGFQGAGDRPGERHPQAFTVTWSEQPVASNPDKLEPHTGDGPKWVLAGRMNEAFDVARLARPEVISVRPLTETRSRGHIWEIKLRLHGGVTLADIRGAAQRIRQALGSEWLRVATNGENVVIVAGIDAKTARGVKFAEPEKRQRDYITALDWEQAFSDAKVVGQGGLLPSLTRTDVLPHNDQVQVLDFRLPTGTSKSLVREAVQKLMTTTGNSFVEVRDSPDGADSVRVLVCRDNPLPDRAAMNWEAIDAAVGIPFATGIEGEPVEYDPVDNPHVLLSGTSGSGKSIMAQVYMYGALTKGHELYVIDPVKGGADFQFAREHAKAFASTPQEAQAVMKAVYAEVVRRKTVNAEYGVGSFMDLPEPPPRIFVMIDEFTSLMGQDQVPPASEEPEAELERELIIASNRAKTDVGVFAGKIAREARSAGVHLLLGTQKLSAKMLDTIPGAADLKDLTLDTMLPVPISERFPNGWARNDELVEGDELYTPFGSTTTAEGFSEVFESNDVYAVKFDDGQVVKAGGGHWWQVSDEASRLLHSAAGGRNVSARAARAAAASLLADTFSGDEYMTASEAAQELNMGKIALLNAARSLGLPSFSIDRTTGQPVPFIRPRGVAPREYLVDEVLNAVGGGRWDLSPLEAYRGRSFTCREMLRIAHGVEPTPSAGGALGTAIAEAGLAGAPTVGQSELFNGLALMRGVARRIASSSAVDERGQPSPLERVVTTEQMARQQFTASGGSNWGVRQGLAVPGETAELPIDPYVLGAWLGDGCRGSGYIVASDVESCTDVNGLTDRAHMMSQIVAAGYDARDIACSDTLIGTTGLRVQLRDSGILHDKHIPASYLRASVEQRIALLQGLMDTDGTVTFSGQMVISQVNKRLAENILELVRSLGMRAQWNSAKVGYVPEGWVVKKMTSTAYTVSFRTTVPVFRLPRKIARQAERCGELRYPWRFIVSIEKIATEPTRCIRVADRRHLFLVAGFLPTHNTNLARTLLGKTSSGDRMSALRDFVAAPELGGEIPKGRGLYEPLTSSAQAVQVWFAPQSELREQLLLRRPVLAEEDRLDIGSLLPKQVDESAAALRHFSGTVFEPEEVVVGDFVLTLDDLEEDEEDGGESPVQESDVVMSDSTAVVPHGFTKEDAVQLPTDGLAGETGWWKLDWLLTQFPAGSSITWFEPQLDDEDDIGVPYMELAFDAFRTAGVSAVLRAGLPAEDAPKAPAQAVPDEVVPEVHAQVMAAPVAPAPAAPEPNLAPASFAVPQLSDPFPGSAPTPPRVVSDEFPDAPNQRPTSVFDELF